MEKIALWLGHEALAITHKRYVHYQVEALDGALGALEDAEWDRSRVAPVLRSVK